MSDDSDGDDFLRQIERFGEQARFHHSIQKGEQALSLIGQELDDRVNFRVNGVLKDQFEKVCVANHTTISREIKRFMTEVVRLQRVF